MHKRSKQFLWKSIVFLFGSLLLFFILRFFHLPASLQFGSDEGRDFLTTWHIFTTKQLTLIGPPSEFTIHGRQFFFGPASYFVILLPLILGKGDPLVISWFLIFLNATVLVITLAFLFRYLREKLVVYCFDVFCVCTPALVAYSQSYWNPYLMFPTAMLLLALLVKQTRKETTSRKKLVKKPALIDTFVIGFLSGLGLQFHYSFIFAIIASLIWLWVGKGLRWKSFLFWLGGIVLGFSPIILFELKSHFYNTQTLLMVLSSSNFHNSFQFHAFYLISLLPFGLYFLSLFLVKLLKNNLLVLIIVLGLYLSWSVIVLIPVKHTTLSYPDLQQLADSIATDHPKQFNIVDQLSGDNRAMALRYLLAIKGKEPLGYTDYQSAQEIYVYSDRPLAQLLMNPVYEIQSFLPFRKEEIRQLPNGVYLYRLEK